MNENENDKVKMVFAKATANNFCAIVAYKDGSMLKVCEVVESENITDFISAVSELAKKHRPELVHYECTVYLSECAVLRSELINENIRVRGYNSFGSYIDRIVSQAEWISNNVLVEEKYADFIDRMTSFSVSDTEKDNIAIDVLSDAAWFFRRYYFK